MVFCIGEVSACPIGTNIRSRSLNTAGAERVDLSHARWLLMAASLPRLPPTGLGWAGASRFEAERLPSMLASHLLKGYR